MSRRALARRITRRLLIGGVLANEAGGAVVFLYLGVIFPPEPQPGSYVSLELTAIVLLIFGSLAVAVGLWRGRRMSRGLRTWMREGRDPTPQEREDLLRLPVRIVWMTAQWWLLAVVVFGLLNLDHSRQFALETATTIALGGLVTCTAAWLFTERELRPAVAIALASGHPPGQHGLGIAPRILLTWLLCSAVPLIGLALVPIGRGAEDTVSLLGPILFIVGVALVAGFVLMGLAMKAVADPVRELRAGMEAVAAGRTDVRVTVDDASEVGSLQAGFNAMIEGLEEREQLRDLFGRQVGLDVAHAALERGIRLGGEKTEVGALFVDVLGSTSLAAREDPERVVGLLNEFFAIVVGTVERHGGFVNKFEGDGALCVFGAPVACRDAADRALAAARDLAGRIAAEATLDAAIGVAFGTGVAGHVGAESRFEYTVIGDPVNEAARLTELAKARRLPVLAGATAVLAAGATEAARWRLEGEVTLRGRSDPTRLAVPV
jgi:adenylate cyclase